jgi:uncharacterized membrane protein YgcG
MTIMAMILAYTVPQQWSMVMKRERDRQTIFLMKQYARSIRNWQRRHGGLPTSLKQLQDARAPRMLRGDGKWVMPLSGKEEDWILVPMTAITNAPAGGIGGPRGPGPGHIGPGGGGGDDDREKDNRGSGGGGRGGGRGRGGRGGGGGQPGGGQPGGGQQGGGQQGPAPFSKLDPAQSPATYTGPFVGVRPNAKGPSFISLNGASDYSEWVYTIFDLENEIAARQRVIAQP